MPTSDKNDPVSETLPFRPRARLLVTSIVSGGRPCRARIRIGSRSARPRAASAACRSTVPPPAYCEFMKMSPEESMSPEKLGNVSEFQSPASGNAPNWAGIKSQNGGATGAKSATKRAGSPCASPARCGSRQSGSSKPTMPDRTRRCSAACRPIVGGRFVRPCRPWRWDRPTRRPGRRAPAGAARARRSPHGLSPAGARFSRRGA